MIIKMSPSELKKTKNKPTGQKMCKKSPKMTSGGANKPDSARGKALFLWTFESKRTQEKCVKAYGMGIIDSLKMIQDCRDMALEKYLNWKMRVMLPKWERIFQITATLSEQKSNLQNDLSINESQQNTVMHLLSTKWKAKQSYKKAHVFHKFPWNQHKYCMMSSLIEQITWKW